jgi:O-antigen biosynthesis protein
VVALRTGLLCVSSWVDLDSCPWCGARESVQVATRIDLVGVAQCQRCRLKYTASLPEDLSELYATDYFEKSTGTNSDNARVGYLDYESTYSPLSFRWLSLLVRALMPGSRVLDIGCASGTFLVMARADGLRPTGSELNAEAAQAARARGFAVSEGPFDPGHYPAPFPVVTALEVMEHVRDLKGFLSDVRKVMESDGLFLFLVPSVPDSLIERVGDEALAFTSSLEHTFYFDADFLESALAEVFGVDSAVLIQDAAGSDAPYLFGIVRLDPSAVRPERLIGDVLMGVEAMAALSRLDNTSRLAASLLAAKFGQPTLAGALFADVEHLSEIPASDLSLVHAEILRHEGALLRALELTEEVATERALRESDISLLQLREVVLDIFALVGERGHSLTEVTRALIERESRRESATAFLAARQAALEQLESEVRALTAGIDQREDRLARLTVEVDRSRSRSLSFENEKLRLERELNSIYDSRAWRLVAAGRRLKGILTGRLRRSARDLQTGSIDAVSGIEGEGRDTTPVETYPYLVSVVVPVFNKGWDLVAAVQSILDQTLESIEVVVWNDGSTDEATLSALEHVAGLEGVSVFHGPNRGLSSARNSGMAVSRGEFLCSLDPDDTFKPTYLEKAVAVLLSRPDVSLAYPWVETVGGKSEIWQTEDLDPSRILEVNHVTVCAMFTRELFQATGGYKPAMREGYEDWEMWANAASRGFRGVAIPEPLFRYTFSADPQVSMHSRAKEVHGDLVRRIAQFNPNLERQRIPSRPIRSTASPSRLSAVVRRLPGGARRPVVLAIPWFTVGGGDRVVEMLLSHFAASGRTVIVLLTERLGPGMVDQSARLEASTPYVYHLESLLPREAWLPFVSGLLGGVREPVLLNVGSPWIYQELERLRVAVPALKVVDQLFNNIGHLHANRSASASIDLTVAAYSALAQEIASDGRPPESIVTVPTGIPTPTPPEARAVAEFRAGLGLGETDKLVCFAGRLSAEKRPEWIVDIAARLPESFRVLVVGDGPLAGDLGPLFDSEPRIIWIKYTDSFESVLGGSDVLMITSLVEGIPLVALESLALGTPVVATSVGGMPELLGTPGVTLVDVDDQDGFVDALVRVSKAKQDALALPERFHLGHMLAEVDRLIDQ